MVQVKERDDRLVQSLYEVADEVEDDDLRDRLYVAIDEALEAWGARRARAGEAAV